MVGTTIREYAMIRGKFVDWHEFTSQNSWAVSSDTPLPVNCISVYYVIDLEQKKIKERLCMATYAPQYQPGLKAISAAWVAEYFTVVEPADLQQLDTPEITIIQPGGEVLFLLNEEEVVVGTVAMILEPNGTVELAKMGVDKKYSGRGYSHPLMEEAIAWAKRNKFHSINLYTATRLKVALLLYKKYGFEEMPFTPHAHFSRVDVAMRLVF